MQYGKILVPYDASQMSDKALERASEIAKTARSVIFIFHVIPEIPMMRPTTSRLGRTLDGLMLQGTRITRHTDTLTGHLLQSSAQTLIPLT